MHLVKKTILLSYISVASISATIITPALPTIEINYHLHTGSIEWIIALFLLGYMAGQLIYGPLSNKYGRLNALRIGFSLNLTGIIICLISTSSDSYNLLLLGRLVTAIGSAAGLSCTITLINELLDEDQAKQSLSYAVLSFTIGMGASIFIGGLITEYFNWEYIFWVLMLHGLLLLYSTFQFTEQVNRKQINLIVIIKDYLYACKNKKLITFSLFLGLVSVISYCYATGAPMVAHIYLKLSPSQYGAWNSLSMLGMLLGSISSAYILKCMSTTKLLKLAIMFIIFGLMSFTLQLYLGKRSTLWFFLTASYLYFFASWLFPSASHLASNAIHDKANASSIMNFINMGSASLCVTLMGYLPCTHFAALITTTSIYTGVCLLFYIFNKGDIKAI